MLYRYILLIAGQNLYSDIFTEADDMHQAFADMNRYIEHDRVVFQMRGPAGNGWCEEGLQ